ncbi:protein Lilipod-like [Uloborus diversus]|uniref:protein Lilipod-like n=1 Tax=Uloborus diversus TaxID=327109 RepID=UPI0024097913|nr:protein Lilipod-like [Uloborus diversus]
MAKNIDQAPLDVGCPSRIWICTFALSITIGAALLLPISIITNEILLYYPGNYYIQFLNSSLIQGLWRIIFLFSNTALFILLPFAHLFIEAEGFPGSPRGIMSRVYEVVLVLALLGITIMGIISISVAVYHRRGSFSLILNMSSFYLPFLYSCVSFFGVLMLLSCTPVGFARLFSVMTNILLKPKSPLWKPPSFAYQERDYGLSSSGYSSEFFTSILPKASDLIQRKSKNESISSLEEKGDIENSSGESEIFEEYRLSKIANLLRNCCYPTVMIVLVLLTIIAVLMVLQNTLLLCFGVKSLPISSQEADLGITSLSAMGPVGAALEIVLILYLWCTSVVGLYSLPFFCRLRPKLHDTSLPQIIGNCAILLILSSALPVLARSLGITNFDLLGDFGRIYWLGNFYIVLFYNVVFVVTAAICLGTKITAAVRQEVYQRLRSFACFRFPRH